MNCLGEFDRLLDDEPDAPILWWLSLYIEALALFPNIEREGPNNGHFEGEHLVQLILTKVGLQLPKTPVMTPTWAAR